MANTYLSRTSGSPTNALKFTYSFWIKIGSLSTSDDTFLLDFNTDDNNRSNIGFNTANQLVVYEKVSGSTVHLVVTNRVFRDPSAWYHITVKVDKTQSTASDRTKIYVNGVEETSLSANTYPPQNTAGMINTAVSTLIGKYSQNTYYFDGTLAHVHFVDGTAYDASTFGETDSTSGIWKPKTAPSVTYGNNGFFLKFENSGAMGTDSSGNSNTFTVGGGTLTQNVDSPTNNFATLNPLAGNCTFSNGNNTWVGTTSGYEHSSATLGVSSGKWYWEVKPTHACGAMGITDFNWQFDRRGSLIYASSGYAWVYEGNGYVSHNSYGDIASNYSSYGSSDIIGVALDLTNNKLHFSKNGVFEASSNPATNTNGISIDAPSSLPSGFYSPLVADLCSATAGGGSVNFGSGFFGTTAVASANADANGHGAMEYAVPSGYYTLNTKNIKEFG